jgi:hypothetical protein
MSEPMCLTLNEVVERYRGKISEGTLRNWRSMRVGPSFLKVGKAVLYPLEELVGGTAEASSSAGPSDHSW